MATVGLLINETKPAALEAACRLAEALSRRGISVRALTEVTEHLSGTCLNATATPEELARDSDFAVVFGGDGTILGAARLLAPHGTPLLGVHLGRFGFITEVAPENLLESVERVLNGKSEIEERIILSGEIEHADTKEHTRLLGINDFVVASAAVRMVHVQVRIGHDPVATYAADGVIVASPTGSTGYSLSAGGPLIHPAAPVLVVTPICAHTLAARALVIPNTETVHLTVTGQTRDAAVVSIDGQIEEPLRPGDTVSVSCAPYPIKFLSVGGPNFYQKIRSRWQFGERVSHSSAP